MGLYFGTIPPPLEIDFSFVGIDYIVVSAPSEVATDGDGGDGSVMVVMGGVVSLYNILSISSNADFGVNGILLVNLFLLLCNK